MYIGANGNSEYAYSNEDIRQGSVPAPMLLSLYDNNIPGFLYALDTHMSKMHDKFINILLYADSTVLMARSQVVLRRMLQKLKTYCVLNSLNITKTKSKVVVLSKTKSVTHNWLLGGKPLGQRNSFISLGIVFTQYRKGTFGRTNLDD